MRRSATTSAQHKKKLTAGRDRIQKPRADASVKARAAQSAPQVKASQFQYGAIAFLDALGWKGMWKRVDNPERMIAALRALRAEAASIAERLHRAVDALNRIPSGGPALFPGVAVQALSLSDTIVIAASYDKPRDQDPEFVREAAAPMMQRTVLDVAQRVFQAAAVNANPLAMRGALAMGDLLIQESFLVGPAVDRAAELMNLPEAACVFVDPAAPKWSSDHCFSHKLQLKGVGLLEVPVMNPLGGCAEERADQVKEGVMNAFGRDPNELSVWMKMQNTEALLRAARQHSAWLRKPTPEEAFQAITEGAYEEAKTRIRNRSRRRTSPPES